MAKGKEKKPSFEEALERLETIVKEMETGTVSLEDMMKHFEEGTALVKYCNEKLNEVERKIEQLVKKGGEAKREPCEAENAGDA